MAAPPPLVPCAQKPVVRSPFCTWSNTYLNTVAPRHDALTSPSPPVSSQSVVHAICTTRNPSMRYLFANPLLKNAVPPCPLTRMIVPFAVTLGNASLRVAVRSLMPGHNTFTDRQEAPCVAPDRHVAGPSSVSVPSARVGGGTASS